jgi:hypothetical protein
MNEHNIRIRTVNLKHSILLYATSVHYMVLSMLKSRYIFSTIYTGVTRYLQAGVRRLERVQQRPHNVTGPDMITRT